MPVVPPDLMGTRRVVVHSELHCNHNELNNYLILTI